MEYKNEHIEALEQAAREVVLSHAERTALRSEVHAYMLAHPARTSLFSRMFSYEVMAFRLHPIALSLMLVLSTSAGTVFASETALPGDTLYPIKVSVSEPIQKVVAWTPRARTQVAQKQTERRLEEAELLAAEGRLTPQVSEALAVRLNAHVSEFESQISADLEPETTVASRGDFQATLEAHADVLEYIANEATEERESLAPVVASVRARAERIAQEHAKNRDDITGNDALSRVTLVRKEDARRKLALVDTKAVSVESSRMAMPSADASMSALARAMPEPETPAQTFARGESDFEQKAYTPALVAFDDVARQSERTRVRQAQEEKVRPLLVKRSERREKEEDKKGKESEVQKNILQGTEAILSGTTTATSTPAETVYPQDEKEEDR